MRWGLDTRDIPLNVPQQILPGFGTGAGVRLKEFAQRARGRIAEEAKAERDGI